MFGRRESGVLLHPTSLPGAGGIGTLGEAALAFLSRAAKAGQTVWQVLPLGPTGFGDSPYQCFSAFAGNPLLVSEEGMRAEGLLPEGEAREWAGGDGGAAARVDYGAVIGRKAAVLAGAHARFREGAGGGEMRRAWEAFRGREAAWLDDYALFAALKEAHGGAAWTEWPVELRDRDAAAVAAAGDRLAESVERVAFAQFLFFRQWDAVRAHARGVGIRVMGDLPIFVAHDSADVWVHRDGFLLDAAGRPTGVAGVPPDYFSETGQLWGNPLYRWDEMAKGGFAWWVERMRSALGLFDVVRIDHFRGFEAHWEVPAGAETAAGGRWVPGPGAALFDALRDALGEVPVVAEDLGFITEEVVELRRRFGFPGMRILQYGFGGDPAENEHAPENHEANSVVYTGTHDNDTIAGWFSGTPDEAARSPEEAATERDALLRRTGGDGREIHWDAIRVLMESVAETVIVPMQDVLGLGSDARMNRPGVAGGNWGWRMAEGAFGEAEAARLAEETRRADRG
ncbi:MAG: 4-alpha-glucanotransferase [Gemmatimonadota bacterium]|nr:4-alpha-glucanotransferase [Gemmatimonadota bacterium]MDP7030812.1 4-alpha-glucanotransferase [Gemmatimonadota bacterium]